MRTQKQAAATSQWRTHFMSDRIALGRGFDADDVARLFRDQEVGSAGPRRDYRRRQRIGQVRGGQDLANHDTVQSAEAWIARTQVINVDGNARFVLAGGADD